MKWLFADDYTMESLSSGSRGHILRSKRWVNRKRYSALMADNSELLTPFYSTLLIFPHIMLKCYLMINKGEPLQSHSNGGRNNSIGSEETRLEKELLTLRHGISRIARVKWRNYRLRSLCSTGWHFPLPQNYCPTLYRILVRVICFSKKQGN